MSISWLFLAAALWGAWFTWNAYRPIYRPAALATRELLRRLAHHRARPASHPLAARAHGPLRLGRRARRVAGMGRARDRRSCRGSASRAPSLNARDGGSRWSSARSRRASAPTTASACCPASRSASPRRSTGGASCSPSRCPIPTSSACATSSTAREGGRPIRLDVYRRKDRPTGLSDAPPDPRRRVDPRQQERAGHPAHARARVARLGLRQRQLPPEPARDVPRSARRPEARDRVDSRARRRVRREPGLPRGDRRLRRRAPRVARRAHGQLPRVPARLRGRRHLGARLRALLRRLRFHRPPRALPEPRAPAPRSSAA